MIKMREALVKDLGIMQDLDLKCQHYPMDSGYWSNVVTKNMKGVFLTHFGDHPAGYMVCEDIEILETKKKQVRIQRFGTLPAFRGHGIGKSMLRRANELARNLHIGMVSCVVPEIHCLDDADNVSTWLRFQGFSAKRIVKDYFHMYGDRVDGFVFEREVV